MKNKEVLETLQEILEEQAVSLRDFAWSNVEETFNDVVRTKLGEFILVQGATRTEGGGDYDGAQAVYFFKDHNVYISVEGVDFDDMYVVHPEQITTTVYKTVKC